MAEQSPETRVFHFDDPRQEHIYLRLQSVGPGPAAFYRDICRIMADQPQLESASHLVSHLLREIESALRDALEPIGAWRGKVSHGEEILQILRGLGIPENDPLAKAWLSLSGKDNAYGLAARAHRDSLAPPRPADADFRDFVAQFELVLGAVLSQMATRFAANFERIDQVLALAGLPEAKLAQLTNALPNNPIVVGYLVEQIAALGDPAWLDPLEHLGYFGHPPPTERSPDERSGTESVRFPHWPQSQFLVRMARDHHGAQAVESITRIALGIPETDNAAINEDLLVVALNLPPDLSTQLAMRLGRALESPSTGFYPEHLAEFVITLLKGGKTDEAFVLAKQILKVHSEEVAPLRIGEEVLQFSPNVHGYFADWMYEQIIERLRPVLIAEQEDAALNLLCDLLDDAIAKSKRADDPGPPIDLSTHWWPILDEEDETEQFLAGIRGTLVRELHKTLHQLATRDPQTEVPRLLETLGRRAWRVYRRLELDLVRSFSNDVSNLVEQRLSDRELLNIEPPLPEYQTLAKEWFGVLPAATQQQILEWIDEGLETRLIEDAFRRSGHEPTAEEITATRRRLRWERLIPIRTSLPVHVADQLGALVAEFGEPKERDLPRPHAGFVGPTSPISVNEILEMTDEALVAYLASWSPPRGYGTHTPEGLGRVLMAAVQTEPTRFSRAARSFSGLDPTYVRALIAGLRETQEKEAIDAVIDLCRWVVEQPREFEGRDQSGETFDPSWGWTRKEIAGLLAERLGPRPNQIPFALRQEVWSILGPLASDPDPTPEDEARYRSADSNPLDDGLNTVRATAILAIIRYGVWVRNQIVEASGDEAWRGLATIPEVTEALAAHMELEQDSSVVVRAVFGRFLEWLIALDREWVADKLPHLFPVNGDDAIVRDAAWETYVVTNTPSRQTFQLLRGEYQSAIERLPDGARWSWPGRTDPLRKLGEHLATAYVWGLIDLDDDASLLGEFYERAPLDPRAHVAEWIGRDLLRSVVPIGVPEIERLRALWERRIGEAEAAEDPSSYRAELSGFGWWFISGRFEDAWSVDQLRRVLRLGSTPDFLFRVIGRLADLAEQLPRATVECLNLLLDRADVSDIQWSASLEQLDVIINSALVANDEESRELSRDAVNRMSSKGFIGFIGLLQQSNQEVKDYVDHQNTNPPNC